MSTCTTPSEICSPSSLLDSCLFQKEKKTKRKEKMLPSLVKIIKIGKKCIYVRDFRAVFCVHRRDKNSLIGVAHFKKMQMTMLGNICIKFSALDFAPGPDTALCC